MKRANTIPGPVYELRKSTQAASTTAKDPKPATLKSKDQRQRDRRDDVFKPSEEISEDFAAPLPVDI